MKLSKEEESLIYRFRKDKLEQGPQRRAISKYDLYDFCGYYVEDWIDCDDPCSQQEVGKRAERVKRTFIKEHKKLYSKGTIFNSYINNGEEEWYPKNGLSGPYNTKWAKKYLEGFKVLRKLSS